MHLRLASFRATRRVARRRALCLGLAGLVALLVAGCAGKPASPGAHAAATAAVVSPGGSAPAGSSAEIEATATAGPASSATASTVVPPTTNVPGSTLVPPQPPTLSPASAIPVVSTVVVTQDGPAGAWRASFDKPVVSGVSAAANRLMNARIDEAVSGYINDFAAGLPTTNDDQPSTIEGSYSVAFASSRLLSLRFDVNAYVSGAAHPGSLVGGLDFDVRTGTAIQLASLFADPGTAFRILSVQTRAALRAQLGDGAAGFIDAGTAPVASSFDTAWAFTEAGLEITFPQYAVAPGSAGTPVVVVPWSALASVIGPASPAAGFLAFPAAA